MTLSHLGTRDRLLETGSSNPTKAKQLRDHKKLTCFSKESIDTKKDVSSLQRIFRQSIKKRLLAIFTVNVVDT